MKTIRERAKEYATRDKSSEFNLLEGIDVYKNIYTEEFFAYEKGASDQKAIESEKACNIFCHVGCPHKTDSYNCLNDKCDAWKTFKRMMEE